MLAERGLPRAPPSAGWVGIHDSALRQVREPDRDAAGPAGRGGPDRAEPGRTRERTWCCGGPEALYPDRAAAVAAARVAQLPAVAPDGVTMCPICMVNLRGVANGTLRVLGISEYLHDSAAR